jgi:hypothetical protein
MGAPFKHQHRPSRTEREAREFIAILIMVMVGWAST